MLNKMVAHAFVIIMFVLSATAVYAEPFISGVELANGSATKLYNKLSVFNVSDDNHYVTRMEFLEALLKCIGMTEATITEIGKISFEDPIVHEIYYPNKYGYILNNDSNMSEDDIWANIRRYEIICRIAAYSNCLQVYENDESAFSKKYEFRGTNQIAVNEAISMIEACLTDIDTYFGMFEKNSVEYNRLLLLAKLNGILLSCDYTWRLSPESYLTSRDMCMLLSRLLKQRRYRYISDFYEVDGIFEKDEERNITYLDYIEQRMKTQGEGTAED